MSTLPEWLNDFVTANFGEVIPQRDLVQNIKDQQSLQQQNEFNNGFRNTEDKANAVGVNDQTGENFEVVVVNQNKSKKDKGLQVEFSSAKNGKFVCASIEDFCDGRYAHMIKLPIKDIKQHIANEIAKDCIYVSNFIDTSIAGNSETIAIETALDITSKIAHNASISELDYKKICSKLNSDDLEIYNTYLTHSRIAIAKPVSNMDYYIGYIKNFKEYKIAEKSSAINDEVIKPLKSRISSIEKFKSIRSELLVEFGKDNVLLLIDKI